MHLEVEMSHLKRIAQLVLIAICVSFGFPVSHVVFAQSDEAANIRQMLESRDAEIKTLLGDGTLGDAQRDKLMDVVNGVIDFEAMGQAALGKHWSDLSEEQRSEFVEVFSDIVRRQSVADLDVYRSKVAYTEIAVEGSKATVETITTYKEADTPVVYEMHNVHDEWLVTDIVLNDVSTAGGYARSFQGLVRKRGFDTLMEKLRARREANS